MNQKSFYYSNQSDKMEEPEKIPTEVLFKTQFKTLSTKQKRSIKAHRLRLLKILYDCDNGIPWSDLIDKTKFEEIEKFRGGFAEVKVLKMKDSGKIIVVKKNCKGDNITTSTVNEIKQMRLIDSKYVIKFIGISVYDEDSDNVAILMEYGGNSLDVFLDSFPEAVKNTEKLRKILGDILLQTAKGLKSIHKVGIMHNKVWQRLIYCVSLRINSKSHLINCDYLIVFVAP